jgi:Tfp pilus assembly protein PilF
VASIRAEEAAAQQDWDAARTYLQQAVAAAPGDTRLMERLVGMDVIRSSPQEAEADALRLLRLDPNNAVANYVMATLQIKNGEVDMAEDSLKTALKSRRSMAALNDLAWLLGEKGQYAEAEKLAREALTKDEKSPPAWDTLGVILMKTGRAKEAEEAFERSLALSQRDPSVFLHMAELQVAKGNAKRARQLVNMLYEKIRQLSQADQTKLNEVRRQVDEMRVGSADPNAEPRKEK